MGNFQIEDAEKRLRRIGPVAVVRALVVFVPSRFRGFELVIIFGVVGTEISGHAQPFGQQQGFVGQLRPVGLQAQLGQRGGVVLRTHVVRADGRGVQPRDDSGPARSTHAAHAESIRVANTTRGEATQIRRRYGAITEGRQQRAQVFRHDPDDVGPDRWRIWIGRAGRTRTTVNP